MVTLRKNTIAELWGLSPEEKRETAEWLRYEAREQERKKMAFDYSKLLARIAEKYDSRGAFADAMGMTTRALSMRLNNHWCFTPGEIEKACKLLDIDASEIHKHFFTLDK